MKCLFEHLQRWCVASFTCAALCTWESASAAVDAVTVNGQPIRIVDQDFVIPIQYARFTIDAQAEVEITHSKAIDSFRISPIRRRLRATSDGKKLRPIRLACASRPTGKARIRPSRPMDPRPIPNMTR